MSGPGSVLARAERRLARASSAAAALGRTWPPRTEEQRRAARTCGDALRACYADLKLACLIARSGGDELSLGQELLADLAVLERGLPRTLSPPPQAR